MNNPLSWLALVALDQPMLPEFETLTLTLQSNFDGVAELTAAGSTESLLTGSFGENTIAVTLVTRPIPASQLEGPCATAWYWPEATESLRDHPAHLLITMVDEGGRALDKCKQLTQLTTALVIDSPACGVFWGPGRLIHEPSTFVDQARQMTDESLPLFLWIDFRIEQMPDESLRLFTTGLTALGQNELEVSGFQGEPQQLLDHCYNVAYYLLDQAKVVSDGDTLGLTDQLQVTASRRPSMFDEQLEVIALDFQPVADDC